MEYRKFDKIDIEASLLGLGTMRLPIHKESRKVDEEASIEMIRHAIDEGINYIDTAYMYHNGDSEVVLGKALKDGYCDKVYIADKMPLWLTKSEEAVYKMFDTQLARLDVECIDFYLIHNVTEFTWKRALKFNIFDFLHKKKAEGKIKYIGFSFHGESDQFKEVVDYYNWDFCQIQFNYMDTDYQAGLAGLKYAGEKNLPVIVMEPLKGGRLAMTPPDSVQSLWDSHSTKLSPAAWGLKWIANFPEVKVILSGMSHMDQLKENISTLSDMKPNSLSQDDLAFIDKVKDAYSNLIQVDCSACNYCLPCPSKINIPKIFSYYNEMHLYNTHDMIKKDFNLWIGPKQRPSACTECGVCEERCPQNLTIREYLKDAKKVFEK